MNFKNIIAILLLIAFSWQSIPAQKNHPAGDAPGGHRNEPPVSDWTVNVKQMPDTLRNNITRIMAQYSGTEQDRGLMDIIMPIGSGVVSGLIDVIVAETFNLAQYRKKQKEEWRRMIQNENNFTDSITSIKGLKDFYKENSHRGALDPSDINFDGIEIRGMRNGHQVIYMSCSIDRSNLEHLFRHSKFNLVLDSLVFNPYECHLPNVAANGIRSMKYIKKGKAEVTYDTIRRPGEGGNKFSFKDRDDLRITIDFSLYSSWINQAIQVHKNVELGNFNFTVRIPNDILGSYIYSRNDILKQAEELPIEERDLYLARNLVSIEGDSFVVPRSYMPLGNGDPMWGTGEYNIKVKVRESCQLSDKSDKAKHWKEDYKKLRQMQNRSGEVREYFETLWKQYGTTLVKSTYKTALTTGVNEVLPLKSTSSGAAKGQSAAPAGASKGQSATPAGGGAAIPAGAPH